MGFVKGVSSFGLAMKCMSILMPYIYGDIRMDERNYSSEVCFNLLMTTWLKIDGLLPCIFSQHPSTIISFITLCSPHKRNPITFNSQRFPTNKNRYRPHSIKLNIPAPFYSQCITIIIHQASKNHQILFSLYQFNDQRHYTNSLQSFLKPSTEIMKYFVFALAINFACGLRFVEKFAWSTVDYNWTSSELRKESIESGKYIPENNLILGVERWKNKLFITVPR